MFGKKKKKEVLDIAIEEPSDLIIAKGEDIINLDTGVSEPCLICIGGHDKPFLTVYPDGRMEFNKNDYPEWRVDNFAREFVNCVEQITGSKSGK